jgi:hypothetical protein
MPELESDCLALRELDRFGPKVGDLDGPLL